MQMISPATLKDIPALTELLEILFTQEADFRPDGEKQSQSLKMILADADIGIIFVARDQTKVVGMASLLFTVSTAEGGRACWLEDMVVRPDYRGAGLGSKLLCHAIDYARRNNFRRVTLLTDATNESALRFYQRHGFSPSQMKALRLAL